MTSFYSIFTRFAYVRQIPIFSKLNWFHKRRIARRSILEEYKKGDIVCKQGSSSDAFYCLVSGRIQAYRHRSDGSKETVEFIHRGMNFGLTSLLTDDNHSSTYEVLNDCIVLKIPKEDFKVILSSVPQLGIEFSQSLSRR